jgi:complex III assembly factor LYRM7
MRRIMPMTHDVSQKQQVKNALLTAQCASQPHARMSTTPLALYRSLLRARAKAFRGDARALDAARTEIRARFEDARDVDDKTRETKMREGREAEEFIRLHVVQAVREGDEENFKMTVDTVHQDVSIERADDDGKGGCSSGK